MLLLYEYDGFKHIVESTRLLMFDRAQMTCSRFPGACGSSVRVAISFFFPPTNRVTPLFPRCILRIPYRHFFLSSPPFLSTPPSPAPLPPLPPTSRAPLRPLSALFSHLVRSIRDRTGLLFTLVLACSMGCDPCGDAERVSRVARSLASQGSRRRVRAGFVQCQEGAGLVRALDTPLATPGGGREGR